MLKLPLTLGTEIPTLLPSLTLPGMPHQGYACVSGIVALVTESGKREAAVAGWRRCWKLGLDL